MKEIYLPDGDLENLAGATAAIGEGTQRTASSIDLASVATAMPGSQAATNAKATTTALRSAATALAEQYTDFSDKVEGAASNFAQAEAVLTALYQQVSGQLALESATIGMLSPVFPAED